MTRAITCACGASLVTDVPLAGPWMCSRCRGQQASRSSALGWLRGERVSNRAGASLQAAARGAFAGQIIHALDRGNVIGVSAGAWEWLREQSSPGHGDYIKRRWAALLLDELVGLSDRPTIECRPGFEVAS